MKEKTVVIEIDEHGNSSLDLEGFHGKGCGDVVKDFQGTDSIKTARNKREFYLQAVTTKQQRQRQ
jgi:hypothetical protein